MANSISPSNFEIELSQLLKNYTQEVTEAIEEEIDNTAKLIVDEVKRTAPRQRPKYYKGFSIKKIDRKGEVTRIIHNKTHPGLVHLLEMGHAGKDGGRPVSEKPHLRPAYDKFVPTMERNIETIIKNGGK